MTRNYPPQEPRPCLECKKVFAPKLPHGRFCCRICNHAANSRKFYHKHKARLPKATKEQRQVWSLTQKMKNRPAFFICVGCAAPFEGHKRQFCTADCRAAHYAKETAPVSLVCELCATPFMGRRGTNFCSMPCRLEVNKVVCRNRMRAKAAPALMLKCEECKEPFSTVKEQNGRRVRRRSHFCSAACWKKCDGRARAAREKAETPIVLAVEEMIGEKSIITRRGKYANRDARRKELIQAAKEMGIKL